MADEIFKLERTTARGADAANTDLSDNGCVNRENAEAENRGFAAFSTSDASDQVDTLLDVSQVAEYLRISRSSVYSKQTRPHVPLKDYYTVEDVSVLLGIGENLVRKLADREKYPVVFFIGLPQDGHF